jgi:hypothetical protein
MQIAPPPAAPASSINFSGYLEALNEQKQADAEAKWKAKYA